MANFPGINIEENMRILRERMTGTLPRRHGHAIPEPILNPSPPRTAERVKVDEQPDIPQPTTPVRRDGGSDDRLKDYRGDTPYFEPNT